MGELQNKDKTKERSDNLFPVVGVGASAGGLDAFKRLIGAIQESSGVAYILVQHLEPTHESILVDILQKFSRIPVQEITNNVRVEPDHVYVIPSNKLLTANDGRLELSPRGPRSEKNMPIDVFFTSLSEVHQSHAIGVVLSGTGRDGTLGLRAIKDHGGSTFAQEQQSAAFDGMPQSAIEADVVDFILAPEAIPSQLAKLLETAGQADKKEEPKSVTEEAFRQLFAFLRSRKGTDFTYYKQTTIRRRIHRRMGLNKVENIADYLSYFKDNISEQDQLYQDLLISVTSFFRDPETFTVLCDSVFPDLFNGKNDVNPLRIWVAGCSTGKEPYSIAICLNEYLGDKITDYRLQIFATDISERSLDKARKGIYSKREMGGVSTARLQKYFTKINGGFQINKSIRNMCVFACHNFLKDPPFAKISFISCRNVLIYLDSFLQKKALTTFNYSLNENGYLLLGHSETTAPAADLFSSWDKSERIYRKKTIAGRLLPAFTGRMASMSADNKFTMKKEPERDDFQRSADDMVISRFSPPGVVVNEEVEIVQFRGLTGTWMEPSPGKPSLNVLKMVRPGLAFELRNALYKAKVNNTEVVKENIPILVMGKSQVVTIEVIPLLNTAEHYYLILFRDPLVASHDLMRPDVEGAASHEKDEWVESERNRQLEKELAQLRNDMKAITEDQETVNGELQSANEELLSGGEELQSLNEELETSKEELQSTNEELTTLNLELFDRNEELNAARLYAESIVATIREPMIILDKNLKVKTANLSYYRKFKTSEENTEGKSFYELENGQWDVPALRTIFGNSLSVESSETDIEVVHKIKETGERVLLLNVCRFARKDHGEELILLAIEDVTDARIRENDLVSFSLKLESQVAERTISLKDSNVSLKHSNDSLEQFATIASHDLQEPLRKIRTFSTLLHQRHSDVIKGVPGELIGKIDLAARRMSDLIHDVLNFSKVLDASVYERVDLNGILKNIKGDFDLLIEEKNAEIRQDQLPVIRAVPLQMNQLFYNLVGNALKFSKPGIAPEIHISSRLLVAGQAPEHLSLNDALAYHEITFQDNGIGISKQFSDQIFLIFQRLNAREHFEGTGIGLALCKRIVLNHKGEIYMTSEKGEWTAFHILLPVLETRSSDPLATEGKGF